MRSFYEQLAACKADIEDILEENGPLTNGADFLHDLADNLAPQGSNELAHFAIEQWEKGDITAEQLTSGSLEVFVRDVGVRALWEHFYNTVREIQDRGVCDQCAGWLPRDAFASQFDEEYEFCSEECADKWDLENELERERRLAGFGPDEWDCRP